jgi:hypothetical protein
MVSLSHSLFFFFFFFFFFDLVAFSVRKVLNEDFELEIPQKKKHSRSVFFPSIYHQNSARVT